MLATISCYLFHHDLYISKIKTHVQQYIEIVRPLQGEGENRFAWKVETHVHVEVQLGRGPIQRLKIISSSFVKC